jgi:hypothetical protein
MPPPSGDQGARLGEAVEEFAAQAAVERFVIAILRWAAGRDMGVDGQAVRTDEGGRARDLSRTLRGQGESRNVRAGPSGVTA